MNDEELNTISEELAAKISQKQEALQMAIDSKNGQIGTLNADIQKLQASKTHLSNVLATLTAALTAEATLADETPTDGVA